MPTALIILAAGQGTRMNSDLPKVLHPLGGVPLFAHALAAGAALEPARTILVTGHGGAAVAKAAHAINPDIEIVEQTERLGTGHAVLQALPALDGFTGRVIVLFGDTPFIKTETLENLAASTAAVTVLGFHTDSKPQRYGRIVVENDTVLRIVEFKDATPDERDITLINSGVMGFDADVLRDLVAKIGDANAAGEYYLTDMVALAKSRNLTVTAEVSPERRMLGIDSRADLAGAEAIFQSSARAQALENGTTLTAPDTVFFSLDTHLGRDVVVEPNVVFGPGVTVETGARIRSFSHLEGAHVGSGAIVGPYARLRPGAEIANDAHIGNFVEIKNAEIGEGAKVNHLSYIGDASVGEATNIGAGTITCNYDGVMKHRTEIGARAFIGSDTMFIAPVKVGDGAMTATGTVVTRDIPDNALAIGRPEMQIKPGLARKLFDKLKAVKAARQKG